MPQKPPHLRPVREDTRFISSNRLILTIGSRRYALDISTRCIELKPSRADVIPIDEHFNKGERKTILVNEPH
jgi:hypothetical protein